MFGNKGSAFMETNKTNMLLGKLKEGKSISISKSWNQFLIDFLQCFPCSKLKKRLNRKSMKEKVTKKIMQNYNTRTVSFSLLLSVHFYRENDIKVNRQNIFPNN